ncbi:MAG TPA: hypothetical protein VNL77_12960 [Roseiflexaceae bacterium]|nr:hypothetical protein [Roseiflexaceae bacterium]
MRTHERALSLLAALALLALMAWRSRPARVVSARVTALAPGAPPLAHVALAYGAGARPVSTVVDVLGADGESLGSATVEGHRLLLEVPLSGASHAYRVRVTAMHRRVGGVSLGSFEF